MATPRKHLFAVPGGNIAKPNPGDNNPGGDNPGGDNPGGDRHGDNHYGERLAKVEAELKHVATREDMVNEHTKTREYLAGELTKIREEMSTTTRWLVGRMDKHSYILISLLIGLILLLLKTYLPT